MDVAEALRRCGGVARVRDLEALGCTRHHVSVARAAGEVIGVARGLVSLPGTGGERIAAARLHGTLTCAAALAQRGVAVLHPSVSACVEVDRASGAASRRPDGVRLHFHTAPPTPRRAMRVAPVPEALDAAGLSLDERDHLVAVDSALHQDLVRPDQVAAFTLATRQRRDWLLAHMDGRAELPPETVARLDLARAGIAVHPQRYIEGVGRVDLVVGGRVVVEADGRHHHDNPAAFQKGTGVVIASYHGADTPSCGSPTVICAAPTPSAWPMRCAPHWPQADRPARQHDDCRAGPQISAAQPVNARIDG